MSKKRIKVSELTPAASLEGFCTLGYKQVDGKSTSVKLDLSYVQKAYENTVDATGKANKATDAADKAADRLNALSDHRDKIVDGYWWRWNEETGEWYNTGEMAKGNVMYATFDLDPLSGTLTMCTAPEYTGANFEVNEETGILSVII